MWTLQKKIGLIFVNVQVKEKHNMVIRSATIIYHWSNTPAKINLESTTSIDSNLMLGQSEYAITDVKEDKEVKFIEDFKLFQTETNCPTLPRNEWHKKRNFLLYILLVWGRVYYYLIIQNISEITIIEKLLQSSQKAR